MMQRLLDIIVNFILKHLTKIVLVIILILPLLLIVAYKSGKVNKAPVREDAVGYFAYLPATIIEQDLSFSFMISESNPDTGGENTFEKKFNPEEAKTHGFNEVEEGKYIDKYPIGVAILLAPFFVLGHILTLIFGLEASGWSFFYQYSVFYGGVVYFLIGMLFLKKILLKYFSPKVTLFTILAITFGTNLLNYTIWENVFSHVYSFSLITIFVYLVPKWLKEINLKNSLVLGLVFGLIILVRPTNAIVIILPLLYGIQNGKDILERLKMFISKWRSVLAFALVAILVFLPQLLYWKYATDSFISYSYGEEGFNFLEPKIFRVLFGTSKGLFFWSPILLLAMVGLFLLKSKARKYLIASLAILILQTYLVASWWNWEYGWSFGHRAFTDFAALFAIGLGGLYSAVKSRVLVIFVIVASLALMGLSCFQMVQYWLKILPPARTTLEDYFDIFLSLDDSKRLFWSKYF